MLPTLFFCLGFCVAIAYLDLVFDVSALPYRGTRASLPAEVLTPITTYYRYVTRNPWLLVFVMCVVLTCFVAQLRLGLVAPWLGYTSLAIFGTIAMLAMARVIPGAQRLASGTESVEEQSRLVRGLVVYHLIFLALLLVLALLQSATTPR